MPNPESANLGQVIPTLKDLNADNNQPALSDANLPRPKAVNLNIQEARAVIDRELSFLLSLTSEVWGNQSDVRVKMAFEDLFAAIQVDHEYALKAVPLNSPLYKGTISNIASGRVSAGYSQLIQELIKNTLDQLLFFDHATQTLKTIETQYPVPSRLSSIIEKQDSIVDKLTAVKKYFADDVPKLKSEFDWLERNDYFLRDSLNTIEILVQLQQLSPQINSIKLLITESFNNCIDSIEADVNKAQKEIAAAAYQNSEATIANCRKLFGHREKSYYGDKRVGISNTEYTALVDEQRSRYIASAIAEYHNTGRLQFRRRVRMREDMLRLLTLDIKSSQDTAALHGRLIEGCTILSKRDKKTLSNTLLQSNSDRVTEQIAAAVLDQGARDALLNKMQARDTSYRRIRIVQDDHATLQDTSLQQETESAIKEINT